MGIHIPFLRKRSTALADEMLTRSAIIERASADEKTRTIKAVLATEQPVPMFDYRSGKMIDEVLMADGGKFPDRLPLLDSHSRYSSSSVLGSVREIRKDGDRWRGIVHFATNAGDRADQTWELVRQGHLEDGSVGYRYEDGFVDIAPGQTARVMGREFKAGKRTLRVVTDWMAKEYSTTPIGADDQAKLGRTEKPGPNETTPENSQSQDLERSQDSQGSKSMNEKLRKFLVWLGLRSDATDDKARQFMELLPDEKRQQAERIEKGEEEFNPSSERSETEQTPSQGSGQGGDDAASAERVRAEIRQENARIDFIRGFSDQVPAELITKAIGEGWDQGRVSQEFLNHFRQRDEPVSGHVGIHDAASSRQVSRQALQAALLMREGYDLDSDLFDTREVGHALRGHDTNAAWLVAARQAHRGGGRLTDDASRALEVANRYRSASMVDVVKEMLAVDQVRFDQYDRRDIWQRSLSSSAVSEIFTTNFAVMLLAGFTGKRDTTMGWCREVDAPNFQTMERKQMGKGAKPARRDRGQSATHGQIDAIGESYRVYEWAQQYFIDFQDWIDDRLGAMDITPQEMGEAAAEVRPDLVYYLLMSNPQMGRDSTNVFHADHNNLETSAALSADTLDALKVNMRTQTNNGRLIDIQPAGIIVAELKESLALEIVGSREKRDTTSSTKYGTSNWAYGRFNVVAEPRLDVGVTDPISGTVQAAKTGSTYMVAENGRYGVEVAYLQGFGRRPQLRSFVATEGRFGRGWDIQHVIGSKIIGYEGLQEAQE